MNKHEDPFFQIGEVTKSPGLPLQEVAEYAREHDARITGHRALT